uniref:Polyprotein n=1 Tax=Cherry rasp leaf virus TaxID=202566 RepID=A0A8A5XU49_CRLV|nr:polyprotein [Cherry rasp leaf virus]
MGIYTLCSCGTPCPTRSFHRRYMASGCDLLPSGQQLVDAGYVEPAVIAEVVIPPTTAEVVTPPTIVEVVTPPAVVVEISPPAATQLVDIGALVASGPCFFGSFGPFEEYYSSPIFPLSKWENLRREGAIRARANVRAAAARLQETEETLKASAESARALLPLWMKGLVSPPQKSKRALKREAKAKAKAAFLASDEAYYKATNGLTALPPGITRDVHMRQLDAMEVAYLAHVGGVAARGFQRRQVLRAAYKARCEKRAFKRFLEEVDFLRLPVHIVDKIQTPFDGEQAAAPEMQKGVVHATSRRQVKIRRSFSSFLPKEDFSFTLGICPARSPTVTPSSTPSSSRSSSPEPRVSSPTGVLPEKAACISVCSHGSNCTEQFCFGFLDLKNEALASQYLAWLLQTKLPGDISCFELEVSPYLEQCQDTMEAIDLWWHTMDRYCFNFKSNKYIILDNFLCKRSIARDQTPREFLAKHRIAKAKALHRVPSRKEKMQALCEQRADKAWDAYVELNKNCKVGEGPLEYLKAAKDRCVEFFSPFTKYCNEAIRSLNPLVAILGPFKDGFWTCFNNLREKCLKMVNDHWLAFAAGTTLVLSLIFLLCIICLVKIFSILIANLGLGVVAITTLVTALVVGFFLFNGMLEQAADLQLCSLVASDFLNFLAQNQGSALVAGAMASVQDDLRGQGVSWCFSALYKLISRVVPVGIKETSILFNSIGSISRSANHSKDFFLNMKEMACSWMDALSDAMALISDDSVSAMQVLKHLCEHDFLDWAKKVERYAGETYDSLIISPAERLKILRILADQQESFQKAFYNPRIASKAPRLMLTEFNRLSTLLRDAHNALSRASLFDRQRTPPFWVHLYSENGGTGKSMAMMPLGNYMLDAIGEPKTCRFVTRNVASKFLNGYQHQPCFLMDEFGAAPKQDYSDEVTMLDLVSPNALTLNMAAIGEKNTMFTSKLIISTANRRLAHPDVKLGANLDGFLRRRNILAEVVLVSGKPHFHEFNLLAPRTEQKVYLNRAMQESQFPDPLTPQEFYSLCTENFVNFLNQQSSTVAISAGLNYVRSSDFSHLKDFLLFKIGLDFEENEVERIVTDYGNSLKKETIFPPEHEQIFQKWKDALDSLTLPELVSLLDKSVSETFVYTLISENHPNVVMSSLTPYECMIYAICKKKYKEGTEAKLPFPEGETTSYGASFLSFVAQVALCIPKWALFCVALCAVLLVGYLIIKFAIFLFSGAVTLLGALAFSNLSGDGAEDSPSFDTNRKRGGVKFEYSTKWDASSANRFAESYSENGTIPAGTSWADFFGEGPEEEPSQSLLNLLKHQVVLIAEPTKVVYNCIALGGRNFLITKHVWDLMPACNYGLYGYAVAKDKIFISPRIRPCAQLKGRDLVIVQLPDSVPPFTSLPRDIFLENMAKAPKTANACLVVAKPLFERRSVAKLEQTIYPFKQLPQVHSKDTYSCGSLGSKQMPACYSYVFETYAGLCTSPLIAQEGGRCIILGLHVVGDRSKMGYAQIVTLDDFSDVALSDKVGQGPEEMYIPTRNSECFGSVTKLGAWTGPKPYFLEKTSLIPSLISTSIDVERTTEPAILSQRDKRLKDSTNPEFDVFLEGMKKYAVEAHSLDEDLEVFEDALDRVFLEIPEHACEDLTNDQVCNGIEDDPYAEGIVMQTAEGFPFCTQRPAGASGKSWLFAGAPGDWHIVPGSLLANEMHKKEVALSRGLFEPLIGIDFPKDEKVDSSKVYIKPKTRLFTILPVDYNILVRKYFLSFVSHIMTQHNTIPVKVGIDCLSNEWSILYHQLRSKGTNWFNGDYSRFDGITPRNVLQGIVKRINKFYNNKNSLAITDSNLSINSDLARSLLMDMASTRYGLTNGDLWYVTSGIPSGFPLTVIVNSLVNNFFIHFSYIKLMKREELNSLYPLHSFRQMVAYATYGDDNLVSVNDVITEKFNLVKIADLLAEHGVTLKNGADKNEEILSPFYPLEKVDFLKRKFVHYQGHVVAPLNPVNITERLHWIRKGLGEADATLENCSSAAFEALFHGRCYYDTLVAKIYKACAASKLSIQLPTYNDALAIFLSNDSFAKAIQTISLDLPKAIFVNKSNYFVSEIFPDVFFCSNERNVTLHKLLEITTTRNICYISRNYESRNSSRGLFSLKGEGWALAPVSARLVVYKNMQKPVYFVDEANDGLALAYCLDYMLRIKGVSRSRLAQVLYNIFGHDETLCSRIASNFSLLDSNKYVPPHKK